MTDDDQRTLTRLTIYAHRHKHCMGCGRAGLPDSTPDESPSLGLQLVRLDSATGLCPICTDPLKKEKVS